MTPHDSASLLAAHRVLLALSALGAAGLMLDLTRPRSATGWMATLLFLGWVVSPFVLAFVLRRFAAGYLTSALTYFALVLMSALGGFYIYVRVMFFDPPDAQSGLIFLIVPFCQLLLVPLFLLIGTLVGQARR